MKLYAFVAMPFGSRPDPDGRGIDFNRVHTDRKSLRIGDLREFREQREAWEDRIELAPPEDRRQPRLVLLFSGHMIDAPDRPRPRFPAEKETSAARKIAEALDMHGAGPDDLALTQGACGGDLLFTEACQQRGVQVHWMQPFREPDFIQKSVVCCGEAWRRRYLDARTRLAGPIRSLVDALGPLPPGSEPGYSHERCNLWLLNTALARGVDKVRFICLWNGGAGDGPGGTAHLYNEVKNRTGRVTWIDTRTL